MHLQSSASHRLNIQFKQGKKESFYVIVSVVSDSRRNSVVRFKPQPKTVLHHLYAAGTSFC